MVPVCTKKKTDSCSCLVQINFKLGRTIRDKITEDIPRSWYNPSQANTSSNKNSSPSSNSHRHTHFHSTEIFVVAQRLSLEAEPSLCWVVISSAVLNQFFRDPPPRLDWWCSVDLQMWIDLGSPVVFAIRGWVPMLCVFQAWSRLYGDNVTPGLMIWSTSSWASIEH